MDIQKEDIQALIKDKYNGDRNADISGDEERLAAGEPLAYVIGWIPFLGLHIDLSSKPLIPRSETEWWTEKLLAHLQERFGNFDSGKFDSGKNAAPARPFKVLDLCAGSGAIGLAILKEFPKAEVWFGEIDPKHVAQIRKNIEINNLDADRAVPLVSDLYEKFQGQQFDVIATNPPYIPEGRPLHESVASFEPYEALFAGSSGLNVIERILNETKQHLEPDGELWMECDVENIEAAKDRAQAAGLRATIHEDQFGRPRYLVAH